MKMIIAILKDNDCDTVIQSLTSSNFRVTRIASTGGFLRRGTGTLLVGVEDDNVDAAINVMRASVPKSEEKSATVFVVPVESYQQF
jgi:uncharacterized protein YaaQ